MIYTHHPFKIMLRLFADIIVHLYFLPTFLACRNNWIWNNHLQIIIYLINVFIGFFTCVYSVYNSNIIYPLVYFTFIIWFLKDERKIPCDYNKSTKQKYELLSFWIRNKFRNQKIKLKFENDEIYGYWITNNRIAKIKDFTYYNSRLKKWKSK